MKQLAMMMVGKAKDTVIVIAAIVSTYTARSRSALQILTYTDLAALLRRCG